jgi:uncharacterized repeat protein (TIGR03803 family)
MYFLRYGIRVSEFVLVALLLAPAAQASVTFSNLASFAGTNGASPFAGLVRGSDGNFYGTTRIGGAHNFGTVFRVSPAGTLVSLASLDGTNGSFPRSPLVESAAGSSVFLGTASMGGLSNLGSIFKVGTNGALNSLVSFAGTNGAHPQSGLLRTGDGTFNGTTYYGGTNNWPLGYGTIFQVTTNGLLTSRYSFDINQGTAPYAGLCEGSDGSFWGTTQVGGTSGNGAVFQLSSNGTCTLAASFSSTNGAFPFGRLVRGSDGAWYGTTYSGGVSNLGTVFRLLGGGLTTLVSFQGSNGREPYGGLVFGTDGNLYGVTTQGGSNGAGTVFQVSTNGALTTLHEFSGSDGGDPYGELVWGDDGSLYGTTSSGGAFGKGTVFRISFSSPSPVSPEFLSIENPGGPTTLVWTTVAGGKYQLQYKDDLSQIPWINWGGVSNASAATMSAVDGVISTQRFYRVMRVP